MVKAKILDTEEELQKFITVYQQRSRIRPDLEYLRKSQVKIYYQPTGDWVGGYVINSTSPYRYLEDIPEPERSKRLAEENIGLNEAAEITCIWIDGKRIPYLALVWIYWSSVFDAVNSGRKYVLGGSVVQKVVKRHMLILPNLLYSGPLNCANGPKPGWIYYGKSRELWRIFLVAFLKEATLMMLRLPARVVLPLFGSRSNQI